VKLAFRQNPFYSICIVLRVHTHSHKHTPTHTQTQNYKNV